MSLRGSATPNIWADDVPATVAWYAEDNRHHVGVLESPQPI